MAGNINVNANRTIFVINYRITGNRRNQTGPLRKGQSGQMSIRRPTGIFKKSNFLSFCFCIFLSPVCHYFIVYILWIMFAFCFVTLSISLQLQYVNVLIKFKTKEVFNVKKPITDIY